MKKQLFLTLFISLTLIGLVAAPPVSARGRELSDREIGYSKGYTDGYWRGALPDLYYSSQFNGCKASQVRISYYYSSNKNDKAERIGRAKLGYGKSKYRNRNGYCEIKFNKHSLETTSSRIVCATMVHEYGHLMGLHHAPNPRSPMYGSFTPQNVVFSGSHPC